MALSENIVGLLEHAINSFAERDFLAADRAFAEIYKTSPNNWTARYFHAMTQCAMGDFSDARKQLIYISIMTEEKVWKQVAQGGLNLVSHKEQSVRHMLEALYDSDD